MTEDEIVGWHHQINGLEFEQALGDGVGQGSLVLQSMGSQRVRHDWETGQMFRKLSKHWPPPAPAVPLSAAVKSSHLQLWLDGLGRQGWVERLFPRNKRSLGEGGVAGCLPAGDTGLSSQDMGRGPIPPPQGSGNAPHSLTCFPLLPPAPRRF